MTAGPLVLRDADECAARIIERLSGRIVLGLPLGIGKPVRLVDALYARAAADPSVRLDIFTALTLERPAAGGDLQGRFLRPLNDRLYGGCPEPAFVAARRAGKLPDNVRVAEFFLAPGAWLGNDDAQRNHVSINYTQVAQALVARGINVIAQAIAIDEAAAPARYSLASNPDLTLDVADAMAARGETLLVAGQVNRCMPFMPNDAVVDAEFFDWIIDDPALDHPLFPVLNRPVSVAAHAAGMHAATLVRDGGTLQIGIGSMGDAVSHALRLRQLRNDGFTHAVAALLTDDHRGLRASAPVETGRFETGLYGATEVFSQGLAGLHDAGVLMRHVDDVSGETVNATAPGAQFLEAAFFIGPNAFYDWLRSRPPEVLARINMTRVSRVNQLYGDEALRRRQRAHARFINEAMMVTLTGAVVSDGLDDGRVVSGIGGQYNFCAMAHALPDGRSIIVLPATRVSRGETASNVVWQYAHTSLPRHLRDIVVTEYGAAELRGLTDRDVIVRLLNIADSRFQHELLERAKQAGKVERDYRIPRAFRQNLPAVLEARLLDGRHAELFPHFPWGSELTDEEARLAVALGHLKARHRGASGVIRTLLRGRRRARYGTWSAELGRLGLAEPRGVRGRLLRSLVAAALEDCGVGRRPLRMP